MCYFCRCCYCQRYKKTKSYKRLRSSEHNCFFKLCYYENKFYLPLYWNFGRYRLPILALKWFSGLGYMKIWNIAILHFLKGLENILSVKVWRIRGTWCQLHRKPPVGRRNDPFAIPLALRNGTWQWEDRGLWFNCPGYEDRNSINCSQF